MKAKKQADIQPLALHIGRMDAVRTAIASRLRALVGSGEVDVSRPPGDDGLFGPGSPVWAVHGDFTAMMIGGVSALLLQMLHPRALAGVWDHSDFRQDSAGRLKRTAQFIATTTFASTERAEKAIARVRAVHAKVQGEMPDGTPYRADDPALLAWVHVAEVDSFLRAHLAYKDRAMPPARQDAYLREVALIAHRLGAAQVPESRAAIAAYYRDIRPDLRFDARTSEVTRLLIARHAGPAQHLVMQAAIDLLPPWAQKMHGRAIPAPARPALRGATRGAGHVIRWALARR